MAIPVPLADERPGAWLVPWVAELRIRRVHSVPQDAKFWYRERDLMAAAMGRFYAQTSRHGAQKPPFGLYPVDASLVREPMAYSARVVAVGRIIFEAEEYRRFVQSDLSMLAGDAETSFLWENAVYLPNAPPIEHMPPEAFVAVASPLCYGGWSYPAEAHLAPDAVFLPEGLIDAHVSTELCKKLVFPGITPCFTVIVYHSAGPDFPEEWLNKLKAGGAHAPFPSADAIRRCIEAATKECDLLHAQTPFKNAQLLHLARPGDVQVGVVREGTNCNVSTILPLCRAPLRFLKSVLYQLCLALSAAHGVLGFVHGGLTVDTVRLKRVPPDFFEKNWLFRAESGWGRIPFADHLGWLVKIDDMGKCFGTVDQTKCASVSALFLKYCRTPEFLRCYDLYMFCWSVWFALADDPATRQRMKEQARPEEFDEFYKLLNYYCHVVALKNWLDRNAGRVSEMLSGKGLDTRQARAMATWLKKAMGRSRKQESPLPGFVDRLEAVAADIKTRNAVLGALMDVVLAGFVDPDDYRMTHKAPEDDNLFRNAPGSYVCTAPDAAADVAMSTMCWSAAGTNIFSRPPHGDNPRCFLCGRASPRRLPPPVATPSSVNLGGVDYPSAFCSTACQAIATGALKVATPLHMAMYLSPIAY